MLVYGSQSLYEQRAAAGDAVSHPSARLSVALRVGYVRDLVLIPGHGAVPSIAPATLFGSRWTGQPSPASAPPSNVARRPRSGSVLSRHLRLTAPQPRTRRTHWDMVFTDAARTPYAQMQQRHEKRTHWEDGRAKRCCQASSYVFSIFASSIAPRLVRLAAPGRRTATRRCALLRSRRAPGSVREMRTRGPAPDRAGRSHPVSPPPAFAPPWVLPCRVSCCCARRQTWPKVL